MTTQVPDILLLDGKPLRLFSTPLQPWLAQQHIDLRTGRLNSDCWRGYRATWQVVLDRLLLAAVEPCGTASDAQQSQSRARVRISREGLFPGSHDAVDATWFSGRLRCPFGQRVEEHRIGFATQFEHELLFDVEQGRVCQVRTRRHLEAERAA